MCDKKVTEGDPENTRESGSSTKDLKENKEKDHMLAFVAKRTSSSRTKPLPDWDTH